MDDAMPAKIHSALWLYRVLHMVENVEIRLHQTVLYNSIYRADDQLLVNQYAYGVPAPHTPTFNLRKLKGDNMFSGYLNSFEQIWSVATLLE